MLPDSRPAILVVDGSAEFRKKMTRGITRSGCLAVESESGESGLEQFELQRNQLVLAVIEIVLPGMTGLDLAAELERHRPGFPILYISALGNCIAVESIARRSPDRILLKPFTEAAFQKRIKQLLNQASDGQAMRAS